MPHSEEWKARWKPPRIRADGTTKYGWRVIHPERLILEKYTDIGAFTLIVATNYVTIKEGAEIGSHCAIYSENSEDGSCGPVQIGKYARVGSHVTIFPDVIIDNGARVGAYSLVKKDVPANHLAYGIPAKIIRRL